MNRRGYSDEEKAEALAALDANGGNVHGTARLLGIPDSTLDGWAKERGTSPQVPALREVKKGTLAEKFDTLAHRLLDVAVDDEEGMRKAGVLPRTLAACAAVDKKRLLTEQPTQITEYRADPRTHWLNVLEKTMQLAREQGLELGRAEAAREVIVVYPEAEEHVRHLLPPAA